MPLNARPRRVVLLTDEGTFEKITEGYESHFATCPDAETFRRRQ